MSEEPSFHRANKNALGNRLVQAVLIKPGLRRAFGGIYVYVDPATLEVRKDAACPIVLCMTHSGWYDGYLAFLLNQNVFHRDGYLMMEEVNLARYFFFTWVGVFGVDRDNVRSALASIGYISGVLSEGEGKMLCMFPQGTMRHPDLRPLKLYSGVATIARRVGRCAIVPAAIRYDFLMEQHPDAFLRLGPPIIVDTQRSPVNAKELTNNLTEALTAAADHLHVDVSAYNHAQYRRLMAGRGSINNLWDEVVRKVRGASQFYKRPGG
jgi:1-acyl-sn-glycerol-3-phosphate acyltransferase